MVARFDTHEAMVNGARAGLGWASVPECVCRSATATSRASSGSRSTPTPCAIRSISRGTRAASSPPQALAVQGIHPRQRARGLLPRTTRAARPQPVRSGRACGPHAFARPAARLPRPANACGRSVLAGASGSQRLAFAGPPPPSSHSYDGRRKARPCLQAHSLTAAASRSRAAISPGRRYRPPVRPPYSLLPCAGAARAPCSLRDPLHGKIDATSRAIRHWPSVRSGPRSPYRTDGTARPEEESVDKQGIIDASRARREGERIFYTSCPANGCWDSACILKCHVKDGKVIAIEPDDTRQPERQPRGLRLGEHLEGQRADAPLRHGPFVEEGALRRDAPSASHEARGREGCGQRLLRAHQLGRSARHHCGEDDRGQREVRPVPASSIRSIPASRRTGFPWLPGGRPASAPGASTPRRGMRLARCCTSAST